MYSTSFRTLRRSNATSFDILCRCCLNVVDPNRYNTRIIGLLYRQPMVPNDIELHIVFEFYWSEKEKFLFWFFCFVFKRWCSVYCVYCIDNVLFCFVFVIWRDFLFVVCFLIETEGAFNFTLDGILCCLSMNQRYSILCWSGPG